MTKKKHALLVYIHGKRFRLKAQSDFRIQPTHTLTVGAEGEYYCCTVCPQAHVVVGDNATLGKPEEKQTVMVS